MMYIAFVISTLLAGFIQGVSGFGAGIVFMSIIPYFLSVISSATISNFMSVFFESNDELSLSKINENKSFFEYP